MKSIFTKQQQEFMVNNHLTMSYREIGEQIGFTERQVRGWLNNHGHIKYRKINDTYFENIDTPLKAYFLGFIYADGWICANENPRNYEFGMELQSQDKYILDKLNEELGGLNKIYHKDPHVLYIGEQAVHGGHSDTLRVYSKPLVLSLIKNGIETNKTLKPVYPVVDKSFFFDWLRGYIDGDGCFYSNDGFRVVMHITSARREPLEYIMGVLDSYDIKTSIYRENDRKYRLMCYSQNSVSKLVGYLYHSNDLLFLKRKYEKIKHLLGFAA